jgi:hypothetical protein
MQAVNKAEMPTTHHTCDHIVCLFVHVIVFVFVRLCGGFFECLCLFLCFFVCLLICVFVCLLSN